MGPRGHETIWRPLLFCSLSMFLLFVVVVVVAVLFLGAGLGKGFFEGLAPAKPLFLFGFGAFQGQALLF